MESTRWAQGEGLQSARPRDTVLVVPRRFITVAAFGLAPLLAWPAPTQAAPCPASGGTVVTNLLLADGAPSAEVNVSGSLLVGSCDGLGKLQTTYSRQVNCTAGSPCSDTHEGLSPGVWLHRIFVTGGEGIGQLQARRHLLLDRSAGALDIDWQIFRSIYTIFSMQDGASCTGCIRQALESSTTAIKPALIMFDTSTVGSVVLSDALPELAADDVTLDAYDFRGVPYRRTIDANGLPRAALRITGSRNRVLGLRVVNVGGNSDAVLIDGPAANDNRIESLQYVGRALEVCELRDALGCRVDGRCVGPSAETPRGDCGDDGIAVRDDAGTGGPNVLVDVDVSGAFDKGIKISDGGIARVERSRIHDNTDGGIQVTLGGSLTAVENRADDNRGTSSANGLAANGPRIDSTEPAVLSTRGNLLRRNSLRGISVRSLSRARLRDDFACGNGTPGTDDGFGLSLLDAAGFAAFADVRGAALVKNVDGGILCTGTSSGTFGDVDDPGLNAIAFNGSASALMGPKNLRNVSTQPLDARGNHWENCGRGYLCDEERVGTNDIHTSGAAVFPSPARPRAIRAAPTITEIRPTFANAGDLVWIYGSDFDAVGAAAQDVDCRGIGRPCTGSDANCVYIDRQPAEIVTVTPTAMVIRAPFTCIEPVEMALRTRYSRGFARTTFCTAAGPDRR